ncbi:GtrA family protein [Janibacter sp. GS2]|uniref:GtrA family protein n=1 Tax=Janibacter sp. GS2 TaxID=3442646 RepID=UPI003EBE5A1A
MPDSTQTSPEDADRAVDGRRRGRVGRLVDTIWHEMAKFGLIGAVSFIIDLGGMNLLTHTVLEGKVTTARVLSGVAATLFAWFGNRSWTFRHRRSRPAHHEVTLFFLVNGLALAISTLCLVISHYGLDLTTRLADNVATIIGIGLGTLFRFWAYRRFVFANEPMDVDTSPLHPDAPSTTP